VSDFQEILDCLQDFREDPDVNKRLREKTDSVITVLQNEAELAVDKALLLLEELNSSELSSYHRTQVWDIIGMLESSKN
jgi:uncharacterized protein (UPF0147 family)